MHTYNFTRLAYNKQMHSTDDFSFSITPEIRLEGPKFYVEELYDLSVNLVADSVEFNVRIVGWLLTSATRVILER